MAAINRRRDTVVRRKSLAPGRPSMAPAAIPSTKGHDNSAFFDDTFYQSYDSVI